MSVSQKWPETRVISVHVDPHYWIFQIFSQTIFCVGNFLDKQGKYYYNISISKELNQKIFHMAGDDF